MTPVLRTLLVEDSDDDAALVARALRRHGFAPEVLRVETADAMEEALATRSWELVLTDWRLPRFEGAGALALARELAPDVPCIVVSGTIGEEAAVEAMRLGAADLVLKDGLDRLGPSAARALREAGERHERRRAEEEVRRTRAFLEGLLETSPGVVFRNPLPAGEAGWVSPNARLLLGLPPEDLDSPEKFLPRVHPEDRPALLEVIESVRSGEVATRDVEYRFRHGDGSWRTLLVALRGERDATGEVLAIVGFALDASERRTAEETARDLAAIVESSEDAIIAVDAEARVTIWNHGAEQAFGWTAAEAVGRAVTFLAPPELEAELLASLRRLLAGESVRNLRGVRQRRDGTVFPVSWSAAPLRRPDGSIRGAASIVRDERERERLELQLLQAQKLEAIARLAGGVAHDFNNLLTAIRVSADFLARDLGPDDPRREDAVEIVAAADRAANLTRQLLAFSRRQPSEPKVLDLGAIVADLERMLRRLVGDDVALAVVREGGPLPVLADRGQLEQVLMNLVVNARDAMPRGGRITLETRRLEPPPGEPRGLALLRVADTGAGIEPEVLSRIFEPFFTTKPQGKGTGLGLSTVYGIVENAGGHVRVETEVGKGTAFLVHLPLSEAPTAAAGDGPAEREAGGRERILLVEDEPAVRAVAARILSTAGYRVIEAPDGERALRLAEACGESFDLLVSDVAMPGMSGPELAERIRRFRPDLPVLYASGYADAEVLEGIGRAQGILVEKPFAPETLLRRVREALGGTRR